MSNFAEWTEPSTLQGPQMPFWKRAETRWKQQQALKLKLEVFCRRYCPLQLHLVPLLAAEYNSREEKLNEELFAIYGHSLTELQTAVVEEEKEKEMKMNVERGNTQSSSTLCGTGDFVRNPMEQAMALATYFGLDPYYVKAVEKRVRLASIKRNNLNKYEEEKEEDKEVKIQETVLFEVLATLFPDVLLHVLMESKQRETLVKRRLLSFLSFHEPHDNNNNDNNNSTINTKSLTLYDNDFSEMCQIFHDAFRKYYGSFLTRQKVIEDHTVLLPFKPLEEQEDVALYTHPFTNEKDPMQHLKQKMYRGDVGTMTDLPCTQYIGHSPYYNNNYNNNYYYPLSSSSIAVNMSGRIYGTGLPLFGGAHNGVRCDVEQLRRERVLMNPQKSLLPNSSILLDAASCQKCVFLEEQLVQMRAELTRLHCIAIANEEQKYYNEAVKYSLQEKYYSFPNNSSTTNTNTNIVDTSVVNISQGIIEPHHKCLMCKELRLTIKQLESKLRESYDNRRELLIKLRQVQLPVSPNVVLISNHKGEKKTRTVSTMTLLKGQQLDEMRGYMILDCL
ncbi:uncharacterized protein TM35_000014770 [Trypanosoma theileri]|uniref:Uncharacterized protein n=1 Tax=Trypanosoma theileri TaxID=67003 RepID=A0A1X0PAX2_9TRYP|nr:uncharacterized protein TM35_000014770 [Trypanosoma theileri]ORC93600.1 hypothetical protein TM35_000014770 [Trypanosoma theileri]